MILSLGLSSLWPPSLIQAPSQCRAQSQRHGFSVGTAAVGGWSQITARAAGVLLARTEPPVPPPRIGTPATPSLTASSLEWPGPPLHLSSCGTDLYRNSCPRSVPAVSLLCWGAWRPHRHLTALNFVDAVSFPFRVAELCPLAPTFLAFCHGCWWWCSQNAAQWSATLSHCHWSPSTPRPTPHCQHCGQGRCLRVTPRPRGRYL